MARKFLYIIAVLISLILAAGVAWQLYGPQMVRMAFVPKAAFSAPAGQAPTVYVAAKMWIARPDILGNPALWTPTGFVPETDKGKAAIFFIHPTSYLSRSTWNATIEDQDANDRAALFVRGQASVFNAAGDIWAPRYRQATFGAFLTDAPEAKQALDAAYGDVLMAFDEFVAESGNRQIILAGHSQGALHLTRLLKDRVAGKPLAKRILAAYAIGWPISVETDLAALGLPACATADQKNCVLSWLSFAEPAETKELENGFDSSPSLIGTSRKGDHILCTNPLTGTIGANAGAKTNLGTLKNKSDFSDGELIPSAVPARCSDRGILLIGNPPDLGPYVLPGNNYHVYDYSLFWANIRQDVMRRSGLIAGPETGP
jgi:Protein of unknown function (DUF3089)